MRRDEAPENEPIFPAPPLTPQKVEFRLARNVVVNVHTWRESGTDKLAYLGGLSPTSNPLELQAVGLEVVPAAKEWIPDNGDEKKQKGTWKQEVEFRSTFTLNCPPSFSAQTMSIEVGDVMHKTACH